MSEIIISSTRRAFLRRSLAGAPGAMIAVGTSQAALPGAADPLITLGAERVRIEAKLNAPGQHDDVSKEELELDELSEVENQIAALVPVSPAGAIVGGVPGLSHAEFRVVQIRRSNLREPDRRA